MKKTAVLLLLTLTPIVAMSQGKKYQKTMLKAIETMDATTDRESQLESAADFEKICKKYSDQWIPHYYAAQMLTTMSFEDQDIERADAQLDRAAEHLKEAQAISPEESEIYVLKALHLLAKMSLDPEGRGAQYIEDVYSTLAKASRLNPENPRATYLDAMIVLNMPDFMGGGPGPAKPMFETALEKFNAFENDNPLWPSWGAELTKEELSKLD